MDLLSLSQEETQVILGGLLGDSYYNKLKKTIRFYHSQKQEEYLKWKHSFFIKNPNQICRKIYYGERHTNNNVYNYCNFEIYNKNNAMNDIYSFIQKHLYSNDNRKKVSMKYLNELTPLGLAVWWMDDGSICISKDNRYGKLSTQCFNYEENILLCFYYERINKYNI